MIQSDENDHIFIYFTDHGSVDLIGFPGDVLIAKQLHETLQQMFTEKKYKRMVSSKRNFSLSTQPNYHMVVTKMYAKNCNPLP